MSFCLAMLAGGVLSPMLEVEVRVTRLDATLLGAPVEFRDQSLYYRSKTVLEFATLLEMHRPAMSLVAILVILFSVVFPVLKMLALSACLFRPALLRDSRIVKLLAFELSKWSMADVMVLAIFMSFSPSTASSKAAWAASARSLLFNNSCFQRQLNHPARLLLVHWLLRREHRSLEET